MSRPAKMPFKVHETGRPVLLERIRRCFVSARDRNSAGLHLVCALDIIRCMYRSLDMVRE